jgi:hypothetical protein
MGVKRFFIIVLVLLLAFFAWRFYSSKAGKTMKMVQEVKENAELDSPEVIEKNKLKTVKAQKEKASITDVSKPEEAVEVIYDDDPVVNASMLLKENILCIRHLSDSKNYVEYLQRFKARLDKNQQEFYESFTQYCQKLNQQHPEYHLTDKTKLNQQKNNAKATSLWGRIIKGEQQVDDLIDSEIKDLLSSGDVNILTQAPQYLREFYQKVIHWDLESVLQNHQYDYVEYIQNYAHQLYLCQQGAECSQYSSTMVMLCYLNSKGCGLDYNNYILQVLTQGQQADVKLALEYLRSQYQ